ncbi:MAG: P-II family nitrogen regulator [Saprospiraceae bacterium]|nr:P-II family nitrogen regulator [Saprospiraceae bacterium]
MKKIEAIIRVTQFEAVRDALAAIGVQFFTLKEVRGYGLQKGQRLMYRGANHGADFIARLQMDIVAESGMVEGIVKAIESAGKTGKIGDGKIFVFDIETAIRIRTGERNEEAV